MKTLDQLSSLGLTDAVRDQNLLKTRNATLRREIIHYPQFCTAVREIASLHERWRTNGHAGALLLYGQSGSGKTTVIDYYVQNFPRDTTQETVRIPVLRAVTPESPTVKALAEAILVALRDPAAGRGSAATKTTRIAYLFKRCSVELLILDEFHHFFEGHRVSEGRKVSDWLKNLLSECGIPVVLCGLPRSIAALNANSQLRRRFSAPHHLKEFAFTTEEEQIEFRAVLGALQALLPTKSLISLTEPETARRFFFATCGLIDYVVKILDRTISDLGPDARTGSSLALFASAFRKEIWADVPDVLNPFLAPAGKLRLLTDAREPFDGWDHPAQYTLSRRAAALAGRPSATKNAR